MGMVTDRGDEGVRDAEPTPASPGPVKLRDLAHVRELAREVSDLLCLNGHPLDDVSVEAWEMLGRALPVLQDVAAYLENLATSQRRGTELQDEARPLRRLFGKVTDLRNGQMYQLQVLLDLLRVRWRGDAKYGGAEAHAHLPLDIPKEVPFAGLGAVGLGVSVLRDWLAKVRSYKSADGTGHSSWQLIVLEEVLELLTAEGDERVEAEAIDVANVCLKMVEARRIARVRTAEPKMSAVSIVRDGSKILAVWNKRLCSWALPGGKVEPGETPAQAQARELLEETGLRTRSAKLVAVERYTEDGDRLVHVYEVWTELPDRLVPEDGCPLAWFTWEQLVASSTEFGAFYGRNLPR